MKKELVCKYCKDEFCVNASCPMRADYCPVPNMPGVCRYEERIDSEPMTPAQCLTAALEDCGQPITAKEVEEIFNSLVQILEENGYAIQPLSQGDAEKAANEYSKVDPPKISQAPFEPKKYLPDMVVNINDIANDNDWVFERKIGDGRDGHEKLVYVTRDRELIVTFYDDLRGTVKRNHDNNSKGPKPRFYLGQEIHFEDILASDEWIYQREICDDEGSTEMCYITKDGKFAVSFDQKKMENNGIGVVVLRKKYCVGQELSVDEVAESEYWKLKSFNSNPYDTTCTYIDNDRTMIITFEHGKDRGVVKEFDEFEVGKRVHIGAIGASPRWMYVGEENDTVRYITRDNKLYISFVNGSNWGTVMLNQ